MADEKMSSGKGVLSPAGGGVRAPRAPLPAVSNRRMNPLARLLRASSPGRRATASIETAVTIVRGDEARRGMVLVARNVHRKDKLSHDALRPSVIRQMVRGELKAHHARRRLGADK